MDLLGQRELLSMYFYNFVKIRNGSNMETEFNAIHCLPHLHIEGLAQNYCNYISFRKSLFYIFLLSIMKYIFC